nr:hypothetical protein [Saprospiraceae bacterium]
MNKLFLLAAAILQFAITHAQTNIVSTTPLAEQILLGNYNPGDYTPATATPLLPTDLAAQLQANISPDSLKAYIIRLSQFGTRHSGSDTLSVTTGIDAPRRSPH